ncbi:family 2 glycoside hydrolase [Listeria grandensis FSL F6-0971]|uniref:Family 2 glycoside hydrolase n=1 Tax=Listeria grandensis FSL F6-0971 TaxID=1265819 RepID=W7BR21_9LIST|nr:glycoside hydrolase family 2 [Listeria grandensis]EUJ22683.1 family 2 glycoside hydrolase [Listeria grandensis FSL F6-0971]
MTKLHPRPQFVRENWESLDGKWRFAFDDEEVGLVDGWSVTLPAPVAIEVPFTYETKASGIHDESHHAVVWYEKEVELKTGKNVLLHFEGSDYITTVWVNGKVVGEHQGGYTAFVFDITAYIADGENRITVRVQDSVDTAQPRGKQRWLKDNFGCWYVQTTGIWKSVWLEYVSPIHIDYVKMTPDFDAQKIELEVEANAWHADVSARATIKFDGEVIEEVSALLKDGVARLSASVLAKGDPWSMKVWNTQTPNLYDITFTLVQENTVVDRVASYFGMRKIAIEGDKILLNNEELYQRLILDQGYWEESDLTPPSVSALELDIEKIIEMGYNGVRKHQKVEDNRFLYLCDKKGLLVWSEVGSTYSFSDKAVANFTTEWLEIVKQNYNHPSIITWVPFNESWGIADIHENVKQQQFTEGIYYLTKAMDPMRPVVTNDGWDHTISDIITLHDYEETGKIFAKRYADREKLLSNAFQHNQFRYPFADGYRDNGQPVIISEFGGIAFQSESGWGYGNQVQDEATFLERFESITGAIQDLDYVCGFCYTQVSDVQQEVNGLLTIDRQAKVDLAAIRDINERRKK